MILYLLKFTLCSATLLLFYKVVLERENLLRFNRFYLLGSLVLSLVLPLVSFELPNGPAALLTTSNYAPFEAGEALIASSVDFAPENTAADGMDWPRLAEIVYSMVAGYLLLRFSQNLFELLIRTKQNKALDGENSGLVLLDQPIVPHSFLHCVFLNKADYLSGKIAAEIIHHERAHVRQRHTLDLLVVEFLRAVCWANPVLYLYRQAIVLNHEFLADAEVLKAEHNKEDYQYLLLRHSTRPTKLALASQFNYSFLKKRFVMMNKQTSRLRAALAQVSVLPLLAVAFFAFSDLSLAQTTPPALTKQPQTTQVKSSQDLGREFYEILAKYLDKSKSTFGREASVEDGKRMGELLNAMTQAQRDTIRYTVMTLKPLPKVIPSKQDYEKYKDPSLYGVWVDEKKVSNFELNKYNADDFAQVHVSRLLSKAQKTIGYKYKYQVDMMTAQHYEAYRAAAAKKSAVYMLYKINKDKVKKYPSSLH